MWSWLEQLKEPVISVQVAKTLNPYSTDSQTILSTLDQVSARFAHEFTLYYILSFTSLYSYFQASKETLTCILNCMAQMLMIPEEVEIEFLNRTIKALTWVRKQNRYFD